MSDTDDGHRQRDEFLAGAADDWFERNSGAPGDSPLASFDRLIAEHLRTNGAVLEVGCADGHRLRRLGSLGPPQARLAGIDPSRLAIDAGRSAYPDLELRVGTADHLPFADSSFDTVVFGFCLYLCDPSLLPRIVAEADRVLADRGTLAIIDFDPPAPRRREYRHSSGLWSYKMDYAAPFVAYPAYSVASKLSKVHNGDEWTFEEADRTAVTILKKALGLGYVVEPDT